MLEANASSVDSYAVEILRLSHKLITSEAKLASIRALLPADSDPGERAAVLRAIGEIVGQG